MKKLLRKHCYLIAILLLGSLMACSSQKKNDTKESSDVVSSPTVKSRPQQLPDATKLPENNKNNTDRPVPSSSSASPNMPGVPPGAQPPKPPTPKPNVGKDCFDTAKATNKPCMRNYDPVCGCNGITYANDCLASNAGVLKWTPGSCAQ